jgi:hypothetical protein
MDWAAVEHSLLERYPYAQKSLEGYRQIFFELRRLTPIVGPMRLLIRTVAQPSLNDQPFPEVIGKDGSLNRDQHDFQFRGQAEDSPYALSETEFSLEFEPWNEWLGMAIDADTLNAYPPSEIVAHCLHEMTFFGFDETEIAAQRAELTRLADQITGMSEEERKKNLIPMDQVLKNN